MFRFRKINNFTNLEEFVNDINCHVKRFLKKLELGMNFNEPINENPSHLAVDKTSKFT